MHRFVVLTLALTLGTASEAWAEEPAPPPAKDPPATQPVFLHVRSKETVTIERDDTNEVVCTSPCDKDVPNAQFHVGGHRPSPSFTLTPAKANRADVVVKPGSRTGFWAGVATTTLSALLIGGGVATLIYGYSNRAEVQGADGVDTDNSYTDTMTVGSLLVLGGVVAGISGGALLISNAKTRVDGNVQTASARLPVTSAQARPTSASLPRPQMISIFAGTF